MWQYAAKLMAVLGNERPFLRVSSRTMCARQPNSQSAGHRVRESRAGMDDLRSAAERGTSRRQPIRIGPCALLGPSHLSTVTRRGAADRLEDRANQDQAKDQRTQIPPDRARRPRTLEPL
jgi:hypothetical protein